MIEHQRSLATIRRSAATALVGVVAVAGVAGCGSKKSSSSSSSSSGGAVKHYRAGEFCSKKKRAIYAAQGLHCVKGHLKQR